MCQIVSGILFNLFPLLVVMRVEGCCLTFQGGVVLIRVSLERKRPEVTLLNSFGWINDKHFSEFGTFACRKVKVSHDDVRDSN